MPLHPRTSQCLISILQLLSCQTQTCINTLCASACILFTYRVKGELGNKQFCFVNCITPHQTSGSYFLQPPVWLSRRQKRPNLHDSQLMFHLFTHMHTHTHTVNVRKCRHFHTYTYTFALKSTCSQRQTLPQTLKTCVCVCFRIQSHFPEYQSERASLKICHFTTALKTMLWGICLGLLFILSQFHVDLFGYPKTALTGVKLTCAYSLSESADFSWIGASLSLWLSD